MWHHSDEQNGTQKSICSWKWWECICQSQFQVWSNLPGDAVIFHLKKWSSKSGGSWIHDESKSAIAGSSLKRRCSCCIRFTSSLKRMVCIVVHICRCRCLSTQFPYHKTHVLDQTSTAWTQQLMCMSIYGVCVCTNTYIHFYVHTHTHILNTVSIYIYPHIFYNYKHGYIQTKASQYPSHLLTEAPYQKVEDSTASSALSCNAIRCWHFDVFQPRPLGSFWGMGMFAIDLLLEKHILKECKKCLFTCNLPKCRTKDSLQSLSFEKQFVYISTSQLSTNILILFKKYQWSECGEKFRGSKGTTLKLAPWPRHKVPKTSLSRPCLVTLREGNLNN